MRVYKEFALFFCKKVLKHGLTESPASEAAGWGLRRALWGQHEQGSRALGTSGLPKQGTHIWERTWILNPVHVLTKLSITFRISADDNLFWGRLEKQSVLFLRAIADVDSSPKLTSDYLIFWQEHSELWSPGNSAVAVKLSLHNSPWVSHEQTILHIHF